MTPSPNTAEVGELVARLSALANCEANELADALNEAADRLAAQQRKIEGLREQAQFWSDTARETIAKAEALQKELAKARALAGLGCDANAGAEHDPMRQGRYTFCTKCGETITQPDLRERCRKAEAEVAELRARVAEVLEPFADLVSQEGSEDFPDETKVTAIFGRTTDYTLRLVDLRRAAELHAAITGEST